MVRVLILDGYTDEPAGLGVPPYIDVYPRYVAGAVWSADSSATVHYVTVDEWRRRLGEWLRRAAEYDILVVVAGVVVPGKYLGGEPLRGEELLQWMRVLESSRVKRLLVGPAARFGFARGGGSRAWLTPRELEGVVDYLVRGDPDLFIYEALRSGWESADPSAYHESEELINEFATRGAAVIEQHPRLGYNLTVELETFRSCPRRLEGGCSFCVTKAYPRMIVRSVEGIAREVEALYHFGARHFRLGRQADITVYGSPQLGSEPWPRPKPSAIRRLLEAIRAAAPSLKTLHIDNVNPGTLARYPEESREALKAIVELHTPGDVAAMGVETADPRVVERNNLKVYPEGAVRAIEIVNEVGAARGYNGLPELLPGVNFVIGLPGETAETLKMNLRFLEEVERRGLLLRRINVRKVMVLPGTRLWGEKLPKTLRGSLPKWFSSRVQELARRMLERIAPPGTILRSLYVEYYDPSLGVTFARQAGSYPLVAELPCKLSRGVVDVVVYGYAGRSVRALPVPLDANRAPYSVLAKLMGPSLAARLVGGRPYASMEQVKAVVGDWARLFSLRGYACSN